MRRGATTRRQFVTILSRTYSYSVQCMWQILSKLFQRRMHSILASKFVYIWGTTYPPRLSIFTPIHLVIKQVWWACKVPTILRTIETCTSRLGKETSFFSSIFYCTQVRCFSICVFSFLFSRVPWRNFPPINSIQKKSAAVSSLLYREKRTTRGFRNACLNGEG